MLRELHAAAVALALVSSDPEANVCQSLGLENAPSP
jgi:hypothetical protein